MNGVRAETKALKLLTLLVGEVLAMWLEPDKTDKKEYTVKAEFVAVMAPVGFVSLGDFHAQKTLLVFLHKHKNILGKAMAYLDTPTCDKLLLHQLLSGLPTAIGR